MTTPVTDHADKPRLLELPIPQTEIARPFEFQRMKFNCISAVEKAGNPNHFDLPQRKHNVIPAKLKQDVDVRRQVTMSFWELLTRHTSKL
jgi:hypothetical protein